MENSGATANSNKKICKFCGGLGWIDTGDCTVLECVQCGTTGVEKENEKKLP